MFMQVPRGYWQMRAQGGAKGDLPVHIFLIIVSVPVLLVLGYFLGPRGYVMRKIQENSLKREEEGRSTWADRPVGDWGQRRRD
jgi:hypothetical protein